MHRIILKRINVYDSEEEEGNFHQENKNRQWWQEKEKAKHETVSMRLIPQEKTHSEKKKKIQRTWSPNTGKLQSGREGGRKKWGSIW